jgi:hypothetical protein
MAQIVQVLEGANGHQIRANWWRKWHELAQIEF